MAVRVVRVKDRQRNLLRQKQRWKQQEYAGKKNDRSARFSHRALISYSAAIMVA